MIKILFKGKVDYTESIKEMQELVLRVLSGDSEEEIWFVEYENLYTAGSSSKHDDLQEINSTPVFKTNRGGQITFHGVGQIIVYFILDVKKLFHPHSPDITKFILLLEEITIDSLKEIGLAPKRLDVNHGVWIENKKIAAIGIRIKSWISSHGLAINFSNNLDFYKYINPCGLGEQYGVTSVTNEYPNVHIELNSFIKILVKNVISKFKITNS